MIDTGLQKIAENMTPVEIHATEKVMSQLEDKKYFFPFTRLKVSIPELKLGYPQKPDDDMCKDQKLYPWECRAMHGSYDAPLMATF